MGDQPISENLNTYWITLNKIGKATLSLTLAKCTQTNHRYLCAVSDAETVLFFSADFCIAQIFSTAGRVGFRVTSYQRWLCECEQDLGNYAVSSFMKTAAAVLELLQVDRQTDRQACRFSQFSSRKGYTTINVLTNLRRFDVVLVFPNNYIKSSLPFAQKARPSLLVQRLQCL
jgi:hypothetical protein